MRRVRRVLRHLRPFKGTWYYEVQVLALVLQVRHNDQPHGTPPLPRFKAWRDHQWRR